MKLPNLNDLMDEQSDVNDYPSDQDLFVVGPPGSGKTSLAVLRANLLAASNESVIIITKNRLLVSLTKQLGNVEYQANTMHSYVWHDHNNRCGFPPQGGYEWNWGEIIAEYTKRNIAPLKDQMIIDEGQNLPSGFFKWAKLFGARNLTVFADEDQTTNLQRASLAEIRNAGLPEPIRLQANWRNTEEIALVAEHFHRSAILPAANVKRGRSGDTPRLVAINTWEMFVAIVAINYKNQAGSIGVIVYLVEDAENLFTQLKLALPLPIRVDMYTSNTPKGDENGIQTLARGITILTGESAIGLEFDTVFLQDLHRSLPCQSLEQSRRMYMLCARARNSLILINGPTALNPQQLAALPNSNYLNR